MKRKTILSGAVIFVITVICATAGMIVIVPDKAAAIGTSFEMASAVFSGAAMLGMVYTLWLQQVELEEMRKDRAETARNSGFLVRLEAASILLRSKLDALSRLKAEHPVNDYGVQVFSGSGEADYYLETENRLKADIAAIETEIHEIRKSLAG